MVIFFDSSSLLKHYIEEEGSEKVDGYFAGNNEIWISPLTNLEVSAALKRKLKDRSIDEDTFEKAVSFWSSDFQHFFIIPFTEHLTECALAIINEQGTKTLDSIQMAAALLSKAEVWITSDKKMYQVMQSLQEKRPVFI